MSFTESEIYYYKEQFRFLDHAPVGAALMKGGTILYVNPKLKEIYHYDKNEELAGKSVELLIPEKLREKLRKRGAKREEGIKQPTSYKSMSLRKDGTHFTSQIDIERIEIDGEPYSMGYVIDLSSNIELAKDATENEVRFLDLIYLSPIPACFVQDRRITYANQPYLDLYGYTSIEELRYIDTIELFAPDVRKTVEERILRRESGAYNSETYEAEILRKDQSIIKIRVHAKRTEWSDGVGIIAFLTRIE